jgi:hypothetical protein
LLARHDAVLHGEERQQQQIDEERFSQRPSRSGVDDLGHHQAFDKADGIEKGEEEDDISDEATEKRGESAQLRPLPHRALNQGHGTLQSVSIAEMAIVASRGCPQRRPKTLAMLDLSLRLA